MLPLCKIALQKKLKDKYAGISVRDAGQPLCK